MPPRSFEFSVLLLRVLLEDPPKYNPIRLFEESMFVMFDSSVNKTTTPLFFKFSEPVTLTRSINDLSALYKINSERVSSRKIAE